MMCTKQALVDSGLPETKPRPGRAMKPRSAAMRRAICNRGWALPPILALVVLLGLSAPAAAQSIAASNITTNSVTITLTRAGYTGNWHYSVSGGTTIACTGNISGDSVTITGLTQAQPHTVNVFATCQGPPSARLINDKILDVDVTTLSGPALSVDNTRSTTDNTHNTRTSTSLKLDLTNHSTAWWYKYTTPTGGSCSSQVSAGTNTATATGLTPNTDYTFKAYSDAACGTVLATAPALATLRAKVTGVTASPLNADKQWRGLYVEWTGQDGAEDYEIQWKSASLGYNDGDQQINASTNSPNDTLNTWVTLPGATNADMENGTEYAVRVRSTTTTGPSGWSEWSDEVRGTPAVETLTAANISSSGATLTLANYRGQGDWYYQRAARSTGDGTSLGELGAQCAGPVSEETLRLTGLAPSTNYAAAAFSNSDCTTGLGELVEFGTLPPPSSPPPPSFGTGAAIASQALVLNAPFSLTLPAAASGCFSVKTYTLTPDLPQGLTFNPETRTISGTPTETSPTSTYIYTATDRCGFRVTLTFTLTVEADLTPSFDDDAIDDQNYTQDVPIGTVPLPEASGGNGPLTYALTPDLPAGLTFDAATRTLSGTPTAVFPATDYTYTVNDTDGDSDFLTFTLTVEADLQPTFEAHTLGDQAYVQHSPIGTLTLPEASGGNGPLTYALTPDLPAGLTFDAATRTLSGTPTPVIPTTDYTYTVTDRDGDPATLTFTLEVKEADTAPTFGDQRLPALRLPRGQVIEPQELPAATGGNGALTYALSPDLPAGLTFDPATRTLSGRPTAATGPQPYEYTATDADVGEPDVARLTLTLEVVLSAAEQAILEDGLAAQGRALLSGATGVIGERFRNPGASSGAGAEVAACLGKAGPGTAGADDAGDAETDCATGLLTTVAQAMLGLSGAGGRADPLGLTDADETRPRGPSIAGAGAQPAWDWESLIWGRSFALPLNAQGTPGSAWTLWGAGDIQGFEGAPRQSKYDGQVRSLYLGVDMQWQAHWLAGAALAQSWGETDYVAEPGGSAGQLETTLTSIYPYVRGTLSSGLEVWAIGGYGRGEAEQTQAGVDGAVDTRDLTMAMGATGVRQPMTEVGGAQLALVGGAGYLSLATEEGTSAIADLDVAVNRARLAVEAAWTAGGLAPYVQVGGRYDGGAGQTGAGLETVAGVRYTSERLEFEARGRWLATHAADGYAEYGGLARLAVKPLADGTGVRLHMAPRWGAADGGALLGGGAALLDGGAMPGLGVNSVPSARTRALVLDSELGYGVAVFEGHGLLTPYGGFAFTGEETRQYRLGTRLGLAEWLNLSLEGSRRETSKPKPANQGVLLKLDGRF